MRQIRILSVLLLACAALTATPALAEPVQFKVMIFNIWRSGVQLSLQQVAAAIRAADPDVVALQEPEGNSRKIADMLGWAYVDERVHLISRFPLYMGTEDDVHFSYVEVQRGRMVAVSNLHLPSDAYGPEAVRDGAALDAVLQGEADNRMYMLEPYAAALPKVAAGEYLAAVSDANGKRLASVPFWVTDPDARPGIAVAQESVKSGDPIEVAWSNAPGNKFDWIGIYNVEDPDLYNYLGYLYTNASVAGSASFTTDDLGEALPPGEYEARLMRDDAYVELAIARFTVAVP